MAEALFNRDERELLALFVNEQSVKEAATSLGIPLAKLYPRVQRLSKLGLLHVTKIEARSGRAIKYYRVVAKEFLIANKVTAIEALYEKQDSVRSRELWRSIYKAAFSATLTNPEWGVRIYYQPPNGFVMQGTWEDQKDWNLMDERNPIFLPYWYRLKLDEKVARDLQKELHDVLFKYVAAQQESSETYVVRVAMAPLVE
jgi:predicted transcriptional regulator